MGDQFGLHERRRRLGITAIEIGDCVGGFRRRGRAQFIGDRSGETVVRSASTAPAAAATTSTTPRTSIAVCGIIAAALVVARCALLCLAFVLVAFGIAGRNRLGSFRQDMHEIAVLARLRSALAHFAAATAAAPAASLAALTVTVAFGGDCVLAGSLFVSKPLGLVGLDLVFEQLFLVVGLLGLGRRGSGLRREQRLGGLERMHLLAAIDDVGLLAVHRGVGNDRQRDPEGVLEVAQMAALVVQHIERDVGAGADHQIVGRALHQDLLDAAQQLQRDR